MTKSLVRRVAVIAAGAAALSAGAAAWGASTAASAALSTPAACRVVQKTLAASARTAVSPHVASSTPTCGHGELWLGH
jgi:hypothetical protein